MAPKSKPPEKGPVSTRHRRTRYRFRDEPEPPPVFMEERLLREKYKEALTDLLCEMQRDPDAIALLEGVYPNALDDLATRGMSCLDLNQLPHAEKIFQFLLEHRETPFFHAAYADSLFGLRRYMEARFHYTQTIAMAPDVPDAYHSLAETHMILKQPERAVERLEQMLALEGLDAHPLQSSAQYRLSFAREAAQQAAASAADDG